MIISILNYKKVLWIFRRKELDVMAEEDEEKFRGLSLKDMWKSNFWRRLEGFLKPIKNCGQSHENIKLLSVYIVWRRGSEFRKLNKLVENYAEWHQWMWQYIWFFFCRRWGNIQCQNHLPDLKGVFLYLLVYVEYLSVRIMAVF